MPVPGISVLCAFVLSGVEVFITALVCVFDENPAHIYKPNLPKPARLTPVVIEKVDI